MGVVFVANAFIVDWLFDKGTMVASGSALIGSVILGLPIVMTAIRDLRQGILSINELVAIAVLAAFASGDYKTAGIVAFFMLMGEIIETRTAEGARASIESLIKLTPTKARRITKEGEEEVGAKDLAVGDVIRIRPGDNVAADGVMTRLRSPRRTRPRALPQRYLSSQIETVCASVVGWLIQAFSGSWGARGRRVNRSGCWA